MSLTVTAAWHSHVDSCSARPTVNTWPPPVEPVPPVPPVPPVLPEPDVCEPESDPDGGGQPEGGGPVGEVPGGGGGGQLPDIEAEPVPIEPAEPAAPPA